MIIFNCDENIASLKYLSSNFNIEITKCVVHLQIKMYKSLFILWISFLLTFYYLRYIIKLIMERKYARIFKKINWGKKDLQKKRDNINFIIESSLGKKTILLENINIFGE